MAADIELSPGLATRVLADCGIAAVAETAERLDGGVSNLTWRVEIAGGAPVVLRLQREAGIFQPYDVLREARVIACLADSGVPVPEVLGQSAENALGAPCAVLAWIDAPHMGQAAMTPAVLASYRAMVNRIHDVDWRAVGLDFLDPPAAGAEAAERDLELVAERARAFGCDGDPFIAELAAGCRANLPDSPAPRLCHGDINVFNYLVLDGQIAGVVDWEQANLGDPLSDWGLITALSALKGAPGPPEEMPLAAPSLARSGREARELRYWMLHQMYKLAVIHRIWSRIGDSPPWYTWEEAQGVGRACLERISA